MLPVQGVVGMRVKEGVPVGIGGGYTGSRSSAVHADSCWIRCADWRRRVHAQDIIAGLRTPFIHAYHAYDSVKTCRRADIYMETDAHTYKYHRES